MITLFYGPERENVLSVFAEYESNKNYQLDVPRTIYGINFSEKYQTLFDPVKITDLINFDHYSLFMHDCLDYYGNQTKKDFWDKKKGSFLMLVRRSVKRDSDIYLSSEKDDDISSSIRKYATAKIECKNDKGHVVGDYVLLRTGEKNRIVLD
jgi:hypothetical protein